MTDQSVFGKYRLIAQIGSGGMADVFLAVAGSIPGFTKLQVIKRLREDLAFDNEFIDMLVDEARISARLNHPNVVQTYEVGEVNGHYFISMEYLDGQSFHRIVHRMKLNVPIDIACVVTIDALKGLHHAHELADYDGTALNVVHRDVTPHNLFVTYDGITKVVDFGIAKARGRTQQTEQGIIKGKIRYMAPEQVIEADFDRRVDLFAVGVMLWELVTKQRFWPNKDDAVVLKKLISGSFEPSPRALVPDVDPELDRICQKALAYDRDNRYATAAEFSADLESFLGDRNEKARRQLGPMVAGLFADKRAEIKQLVEAHMSGVQSSAPIKLEPASPNSLSASSSTPTSTSADHLRITGTAQTSVSSLSLKTRDSTLVSAQSKSFSRFIMAGAALLLLGGVGVWRAASKPAVVRQAAASDVDAGGKVEDPLVTISLRATPPNAVFYLDDGPPLENPQLLRLPRDANSHVLRIEAPGFAPKRQPLPLALDTAVNVSLEKVPTPTPSVTSKTPVRWTKAEPRPKPEAHAPAAVPAAASTIAAPTTPVAVPSATPNKKPPMDPGDPWK